MRVTTKRQGLRLSLTLPSYLKGGNFGGNLIWRNAGWKLENIWYHVLLGVNCEKTDVKCKKKLKLVDGRNNYIWREFNLVDFRQNRQIFIPPKFLPSSHRGFFWCMYICQWYQNGKWQKSVKSRNLSSRKLTRLIKPSKSVKNKQTVIWKK